MNTTIRQLTPEELASLNPGIRATVQILRKWGFETCDSGDGKTRQFECDLPCPYVHIRIPDASTLHARLATLISKLRAIGVEVGMCNETGDSPTIEGAILADMSAWIHLFNVVIPETSL